VKAGQRVLIAAHGNSLRALVKYLDGISDADIIGLNIPTGVPLVYELDDGLRPISSRYLGDPAFLFREFDLVWRYQILRTHQRPVLPCVDVILPEVQQLIVLVLGTQVSDPSAVGRELEAHGRRPAEVGIAEDTLDG
jgi:hypothetical protein